MESKLLPHFVVRGIPLMMCTPVPMLPLVSLLTPNEESKLLFLALVELFFFVLLEETLE
jgi:hypothetical protein